ncbi:aminoglycoside phosphotransferase family protein [Halomonas sp. ML-15]|uniref:aminoglycoside phosphotransferase family protein n=1 Tax=Halomonas sp. ML-15 TaxID=2773305 RepID=UPI001746EE5A|nr:aminoglycoside phosphotransferase family protein [Halomonas sp. ML-15]MBD3895704.1 aminoglycoside phosphotransferase family protein [Halomonas sp. ML-15]
MSLISLDAVRSALANTPWAEAPLQPLEDSGLAHWHLRLGDSGWLMRIPKQSQMGLEAAAHLVYEAGCFAHAAPSGVTPPLAEHLAPSRDLPRGALVVKAIEGRPAELPGDLTALMRSLAAIHRLALPEASARTPLLAPHDPLAAMFQEIQAQAEYLAEAGLSDAAEQAIRGELATFAATLESPARPEPRLITFDAHPGNFLVDRRGKAWMVDLEKARYSYPGFDLAHATLYTSTTWDLNSHAVLDSDAILAAYDAWEQAMGDAGRAYRPWHMPLRRAMWLWSVTWCAKWQVTSGAPPLDASRGQDWSRQLNSGTLNAHVQERVAHYLSAPVVETMAEEFHTLASAFGDDARRSASTAAQPDNLRQPQGTPR